MPSDRQAPPPDISAISHARVSRGSAAWLKRFLMVSVAALTVAVILAGLAYYRLEADRIQTQKYNEIAAIAASKVAQIDRWRHERITEGRKIAKSVTLRNAIEGLVRSPGEDRFRSEVRERLALELEDGGYAEAYLLTAAGDPWLSGRPDSGLSDLPPEETINKALKSDQPVLGEFRRSASGKILLDCVTVLRDQSGGVLALVVLSSDAEDFLYPMLQNWPTPSPSAETLIVRRIGGDVLFLNELRHRHDTALKFRQPLSARDLPAGRAVMGQTGLFLGADYRGESVLADLRAIPGTAWFMVAKVDTAEIHAEVRYRAVAIGIGVSLLVMIVAAGSAYAYRTRQSSERRRAALALKEVEAQQRFALGMSRVGGWEMNLWDHSVKRTLEHDRIFGYETLLPQWSYEKLLEHVVPADRARVDRSFVDATNTFSDWKIECRIRRTDDEVRWIWAAGRHQLDVDGAAPRMAGVVQDITDRKLLEENLRQRNEELLRFVYTVSHDLKSPLVTIHTFLGFLEQDRKLADSGRADKDIAFIRSAADKMATLLDELLELSRIGRKMNPSVDVPLQTLVNDALDMVAGRLTQNRVRVKVTEEPVVLNGDRARLLEVFENLIDNAAKFMGDQADPQIEIGVEEAGQSITMFVRDNGVGIDPRHKSKLFGLFEKLHPHTDGNGIGLALVKRIVEVHGGRIWVDSDGPGQGTTFRFTLSGTVRR